jgi:ATP-dependent RNA helicase RhlE
MEEFKKLGLDDDIIESLGWMNFEKPTPIQAQAIPLILEGNDMIACAQTGTGKTGAFIIPVLQLAPTFTNSASAPKALVIVPTRELAMQIDQQIQALGYFASISSIAMYGGGDGKGFQAEVEALKNGVDIVVATPGKLLSHLNLGSFNAKEIKFLVLDEADRMLDMGFSDDLNRIIDFLPEKRQNLLFSATMPKGIRQMAQKLLKNPKEISLALSKPAAGVKQLAYSINEGDKVPFLKELLKERPDYRRTIVFADTKAEVKNISFKFQSTGYPAKSIHSDKLQSEREDILNEFKAGNINVLIATNVISRGIHIDDIDLVVNYNVPKDAEDYVHRIGRTARAAKKGEAITFVVGNEQTKFQRIEKLIDTEINLGNLPETYSQGPIYDRNNPIKEEKRKFGNNSKGKKSYGNKPKPRRVAKKTD